MKKGGKIALVAIVMLDTMWKFSSTIPAPRVPSRAVLFPTSSWLSPECCHSWSAHQSGGTAPGFGCIRMIAMQMLAWCEGSRSVKQDNWVHGMWSGCGRADFMSTLTTYERGIPAYS